MQSIYKEIFNEYDRNRLLSDKNLERKKEEIYNKIPRIKEIDNELKNTGLNIIKQILNNNFSEELLKSLENINRNLEEEKTDLLNLNGFPSDYLTNSYKCNECNDTGYNILTNQRCTCLKQKKISKLYDLSNLSSVLKFENFEHFDFRYYSKSPYENKEDSPLDNIRNNYTIATKFVSDFGSVFTNLLLVGDSGLGKTFLCNCIAKEIIDKGETVLYVTAPQMFKTIEDYRFNRGEKEHLQEYIDIIYGSKLLIIDDLGTEVSSSVTTSELFNIINNRILEKKPTIISTNLESNNFKDRYSDRISSRFFGNYTMLGFYGEDIRLLKKHNKKFV